MHARARHATVRYASVLAALGLFGTAAAPAQPHSIRLRPFNVGGAGPHTNQDDDCPTVADPGGPPLNLSIIYVDAHAAGMNTGRCWRNAFTDLQEALAHAALRGMPVEVWVADGIYRPDRGSGDVYATFALLNDVAIYGGFRGGESMRRQRNTNPATNNTILSGVLAGSVDPPPQSMHVVTSIADDRTAVLDAFTIAGGRAESPDGTEASGGGLVLLSSSATIRNCRFGQNTTSGLGGAVYIDGGAPLLHSCSFLYNQAAQGGAIAAVGGANLAVRYCTFVENLATNAGGALFTTDGADGIVNACTFIGNTGATGGGASLAGLSRPVVVNCLFNGNQALLGGGVAYADSSLGRVVNCTFTANRATVGAGLHIATGGEVLIRNSILWDNVNHLGGGGPQFHTNQDNDPDIEYSVVQSWNGGVGNLNVDPRFRDPFGADNVAGNADDNLRLLPTSPCIDAANNAALTDGGIASEETLLDLDREPRFRDDPQTPDTGVGPPPVVDMGPYEYNRTASVEPGDP